MAKRTRGDTHTLDAVARHRVAGDVIVSVEPNGRFAFSLRHHCLESTAAAEKIIAMDRCTTR